MATWALLLLAAMLLGNPGLVFSRLSPEYLEVATAHPCDKEQSCLCLAQEGPQGDLLIKMQELAFDCKTCLRIVQTLKVMVKQPTQHPGTAGLHLALDTQIHPPRWDGIEETLKPNEPRLQALTTPPTPTSLLYAPPLAVAPSQVLEPGSYMAEHLMCAWQP
ncbi:hypothetical protein H8959_012935 [Pygathrix nigripes]